MPCNVKLCEYPYLVNLAQEVQCLTNLWLNLIRLVCHWQPSNKFVRFRKDSLWTKQKNGYCRKKHQPGYPANMMPHWLEFPSEPSKQFAPWVMPVLQSSTVPQLLLISVRFCRDWRCEIFWLKCCNTYFNFKALQWFPITLSSLHSLDTKSDGTYQPNLENDTDT